MLSKAALWMSFQGRAERGLYRLEIDIEDDARTRSEHVMLGSAVVRRHEGQVMTLHPHTNRLPQWPDSLAPTYAEPRSQCR